MLEKVKNYVEKRHMLKSEDRVIVGVSGGADSICLVLVLLELQKSIDFDMVAVHVNHGLRGAEADADEAYVKAFCAEHGILCESYFADVELIAKNRKQSTEEAGREVRREFFRQALRTHCGTKIALAHHQDDSAETLLINLARGTGLKGLGGIAPVKGEVIRPLLCVRRSEIETYLQNRNVSYCIDRTNQSDEYTRNRIRNHVIPYLEREINPKVVEHMNETMEQIRQIQELLETQTQEAWEQCVVKGDAGYIVMEKPYRAVTNVVQPLLLKRVLTEVSGHEKDLESVHFNQLQELFDKQSGRKVDLPYQMEGKRIYQGIAVRIKNESEEELSEEIIYDTKDSEAVFHRGSRTIRCRIVKEKTLEKSNTGWFDCDIIENNLSFRTRREGDYITIHPDGRKQKLKSYFINQKIPQEERDRIMLVADGNHILWIVGHRQNCAYQVTTETKRILEIQIDEGESYGRDN